jgi:hypothetical protein
MKPKPNVNVSRQILTTLAFILGLPLLGYLAIAASSLHSVNQDMRSVFKKNGVTFESLFCYMESDVIFTIGGYGQCTFRATSEQYNTAVERLKLQQIEAKKEFWEYDDLDRKDPKLQEEMLQSSYLHRIKTQACWTKLSSRSPSDIVVFKPSRRITNSPFPHILILYAESTKEGCIQFEYPAGFG